MSLVLRDPFSVIFSWFSHWSFLPCSAAAGRSVDPAALNGASPLQWFLPGVIVMICLFGTSTHRFEPAVRDQPGLLRACPGSPLHRSAILIGKALKELAPLVVQAALVTLVSIPFGFKLYPIHVLAGCCARCLRGRSGAFSNALAIASRSGSGCSGRSSNRCCSHY